MSAKDPFKYVNLRSVEHAIQAWLEEEFGVLSAGDLITLNLEHSGGSVRLRDLDLSLRFRSSPTSPVEIE